MKLIEQAIRFPVTTTVGVLLLILFGVIGLVRLPIQLTPNVEEPKITVQTLWPGASPHEVEREIIEEQEEQLKSLDGLVKMESTSTDSAGTITLTFRVGTDLDAALLKVSNHLQQVPSYPPDAEKPVIRSVDVNANAIAWFILSPTEKNGFKGDVSTLYQFADETIKPAIERVPGIAAANIYGGRPTEVHIIVDPQKLAARGITYTEVAAAIARENQNISGGDFAEGKRRYIIRTLGEFETPRALADIVVAIRNNVPVYLRDVATVELAYRKPSAIVFQRGQKVIAINAVKEAGENLLQVMKDLKTQLRILNREVLVPRGLQLTQVYDETQYVYSAIHLVIQSLIIGSILAVIILLLYLRSWTSTLVIGIAIPVSIVATFMLMYFFDRTLNVISLAGLAFASGMVVDNSIVVLENIYRHCQMGKNRIKAAHDGAREVWGAVLASTLTTIAVFVPVVFIRSEVGQLFGDIAIAISCAVGLSLILAITVIPSLSARILTVGRTDTTRRPGLARLDTLARRYVTWVTRTVANVNRSTPKRLAIIVGFTVISLGLSWLLMPRTEYLPTGNDNFIFGILLPPPGYNIYEVARMQDIMAETLRPLWEAPPDKADALPGGGIHNYFFVATPNLAFMGARARKPDRVRELLPVFQQATRSIPGTIGVINQRSIFERGRAQGRTIDVQITGPDIRQLVAFGGEIFGRVMQLIPGAQARPIPSLDLGNPEVHVIPIRRRLAEVGMSSRDLGFAVNALIDGAKVDEYFYQGRKIDMILMSPITETYNAERIGQLPIATPIGKIVTLGSLADIRIDTGPAEIAHRERQRTITIQVTPPRNIPLEQAMNVIETQILQPMRQQGRLGGLYQAHLSGTADKLSVAARELRFNFILALIITYLLMAALFENFLYPLVIMFSVPLAALGGFVGLSLTNRLLSYQPLDVITMLGFIILVGTVVNNAILIVHQSLNHIRDEGMPYNEAITEAVRNRIRPIYMSVSTSVFGMLPLVLFPGPGSELYRGLGSVVVGGLILSTFFTLFLVPSLFSLTYEYRERLARRMKPARPSLSYK